MQVSFCCPFHYPSRFDLCFDLGLGQDRPVQTGQAIGRVKKPVYSLAPHFLTQ
jgi:hypothetical protein